MPVQVDGEPWIQSPGEVVILKSALKVSRVGAFFPLLTFIHVLRRLQCYANQKFDGETQNQRSRRPWTSQVLRWIKAPSVRNRRKNKSTNLLIQSISSKKSISNDKVKQGESVTQTDR